MNENLKIFGIILLLSTIVSVGMISIHKSCKETYKVKITFCDGRQPIVTTVETIKEPSRYSIINDKRAVPEYKGYLNVCDVKVIN
jgi:hypothetical protein